MRLLRSLTARYEYANPFDQRRALWLLVISGLVTLIWLMWVVIIALQARQNPDILQPVPIAILSTIPVAMALIVAFVLDGRLSLAAWTLVVLLFFALSTPPPTRMTDPKVTALMIPMVAAGLLLGRRALVGAVVVTIGVLAVSAVAHSGLTEPETVIPADQFTTSFFLVMTGVLVVGFFLYIFGGGTKIAIDRAQTEVEQARLVAYFGSGLDRADEFAVYDAALNLLRRDLGYLFAQVYLTDDDGHINRRVVSSAGQRDYEAVVTAAIGPANALAEAARTGQLALVTLRDPELRRNHLLPSVNFGAAVPILNSQQVIGVLDVQTNATRVSRGQLDVLTALGVHVGTLVRDLRLVNELRHTVTDQQTSIESLRTQLRESRQVERINVRSAWENYLQRRGHQMVGFDFDPDSGEPVLAYDLPETLQPALETGQPQIKEADGARMVNVPINLRGEVLGAMAFKIPEGHIISERQIELAQNVANRLALALENKRLFEQSQAQALRERKANEVAGLLISATDVETVMNLASATFNETLGAIRTRIQLDPDAFSETAAAPETPSAAAVPTDESGD